MYTRMAAVPKFKRLEKSFDRWLHGWKMMVPANYPIKDLRPFSHLIKPTISQIIQTELADIGSVKVNLTFYIHLHKETQFGTDRIIRFFKHNKPFPVITFNQEEVSNEIDEVVNLVFNLVDVWVQRGSGWVLDRVENVYLDFARYVALKLVGTFPFPPFKNIINKKKII